MELSEALKQVDLPTIIGDFAPDSGAKPNTKGVILATWRGNENTPAFSLQKWQDVWLWKDQATGGAGNAYSFATKIMGLNDIEARELIESYVGQKISQGGKSYKSMMDDSYVPPKQAEDKPVDTLFSEALLRRLGTRAPKALSGRGFTGKDLSRYMIVHDEDDAIFPIFNHNNEIVQWKRRYMDNPKMRYSYELEGHGGPPTCIETERDFIIVIEGELNAMIAASVMESGGVSKFGFMGVAGSNGLLNFNAIRDKTVLIYTDPDEAGVKARQTWCDTAIHAGATSVYQIQNWGDDDFCDIAGTSRQDLFESLSNAIAGAVKMYSPLDREVGGYTVREIIERKDEFINGRDGLKTGFVEIDAYTGGLVESGVILVGALPSFGKSALMRCILQYHLDSRPDSKIALFSPDQSAPSMFNFMASLRCGIPQSQVKRRVFSKAVIERYQSKDPSSLVKIWSEAYNDIALNYSKRFIIFDEMKVGNVMKMFEPMIDRGVDMFAGDYAQQFVDGDDYDDNRGQKKVAQKFKEASRRWKMPVLLAAQLAKSKFGRMVKRTGFPIANDIEGTGAWQQVAEQIFLIYNQDMYYKEFQIEPDDHWDESDVGKSRIYVAKNKEGARGDFRYLAWDKEFATFRNLGE